MLTIDLRRLSKAPVEVEGGIASDDPLWSGTGLELTAPVAVRARAEGSASRGVWVRGSLSGRIRTSCRRCLETLELEVAEDLEILFDPKTSAKEGDLLVHALDPRAEELDLRESIRERLLLAVPAYPVCREDCPGLCPRCGAKLSEGSGACDCGGWEPDPRWAPLEALKGRG